MASLAGMFRAAGFTVTGSDHGAYPPMSDFLAEMGIEVFEGYSPANLDPRPDLVVVGNVIRRTNPEAMELERSGVPFLSMPEAVTTYFAGDRTRIVVAGTHGKTTVSAMIAWILVHEGRDPGFMIGGIPRNLRTNHRLGHGRFFVLEGDEYDTAYFDKRPKFLHYRPDVAVVTSCEFDHADIYRDIEQIKDRFREFVALVPAEGSIVAWGDDPVVGRLMTAAAAGVQGYGLGSGVRWRVAEATVSEDGISTVIVRNGSIAATGVLPLFGVHNVLNATAAIAACHRVGIDPQAAMEALRAFEGVKRRQEIICEAGGIVLMDDFAHHPTAVKETCTGIKTRFAYRRLVAVFEPRTNTSKRSLFQQEYVPAFASADVIVARQPRGIEDLPESDRFNSHRLAKDLRALGKQAEAFDDTDGVFDFLCHEMKQGDIILVMSNGSFDNLNTRLKGYLEGEPG